MKERFIEVIGVKSKIVKLKESVSEPTNFFTISFESSDILYIINNKRPIIIIYPKTKKNKTFAPASSLEQKNEIKYMKDKDEKFIDNKSNPKYYNRI